MESLGQDLRQALRGFLRARGFTTTVLLILVLGTGLNTAVFSVVSAVLLRPLPYEDPDRLVFVSEAHPQRGSGGALRPANFFDWQARNTVFEGASSSSSPVQVELSGGSEPEHLSAERVLEGYFSVLGRAPLLGRTFEASDYRPTPSGASGGVPTPDVVVLSYGFWRRRFAADPSAIGQTLRLDEKPFTVVGVMPHDFQGLGGGRHLWLPWVLTPEERTNRQTHELFAIARMKPGVSLEQATAEMSVLYGQLEQQFPAENRDWRVEIQPWRDVLLGPVRRPLLVLLGATGLVLLIACANAAGILLARAVDREKEMATRLALGASRERLVRQLFVEGFLLAGASAGISLLVVLATNRALSSLSLPTAIPFVFEPRLDLRVFAAITLLSVLVALLLGLAPALQTFRFDLRRGMAGGATTDVRKQRLHRLLVVSQMALGFVLLGAGGLMFKSLSKLQEVPLGFDPQSVLAVQIDLPETRYPTDDAVRSYVTRALDELASLPGAQAVACTSDLPLTRLRLNLRFAIEGRPQDAADRWSAAGFSVSPSFFRAIRSEVTRGRTFDERDTLEAPGVVVIDEILARAYWPDEDVLGKRIQFPYPDLKDRWFSVVGVIPSILYESPAARPERALYLSQAQLPFREFHLLVRTDTRPLDLVGSVKARLMGIDPDLPTDRVQTLEQVVRTSLGEPRLRTWLLGLFAFLALGLASVGLFGLVAYSVARRTREIGVRLALGATRRRVLGMVMGQGLAVAAAGIGLGLVLFLALARFLRSLLYGVDVADLPTHLAVATLLAAGAALASSIPALRASRIDPAIALRRD